MYPLLHLGELGSSLMQLVLAMGVASLIPVVLDRHRVWHRALIFAVAAVLTLRYLHWRATETLTPLEWSIDAAASWSFFLLEAGAGLSSLSAFAVMSGYKARSGEVETHRDWWRPAAPPRVAVLIATYNEDREVLSRTIIGAKALHHPDFDVYILDDGRRDWLRDFCAERDVRYLRRDDNKGAKAGNMNNAVRVLAVEGAPDFIAVLDADFVPHRNFLERTLALFHDPTVGLVQTPQHFFNADPIQHNLGLSRSYPDEQRFFFDHLQPARDGWGIAFCCGTSSVARMRAVLEIGGFPTESITEDFMLTLALQDRGHRTVYLDEPLTEGLAPEGLKEYITQRARWCLGLMQIARSRLGPLGRSSLRLRDRWSVADSVLFWLTTFQFRLAALIYPLFYWYFNVTVVDASVPEVIAIFGVYYVWIIAAINFISGGMILPIFNDVTQLLGAIPITRAAWTGLIKPKGHPFSVTAKGGDRNRIVVQWAVLQPFAILLALNIAGVLLGILVPGFAFNEAGDGKAVILFWTIYNIIVLSICILACVELPRRELHLGDKPERAIVKYDGAFRNVWITSLTTNTVRVRGAAIPDDHPVHVEIRGVGDVVATVAEPRRDGARLLLEPTEDQYEALLRRFHAEGEAPGVARVRMLKLLDDLARRLSFSRANEGLPQTAPRGWLRRRRKPSPGSGRG